MYVPCSNSACGPLSSPHQLCHQYLRQPSLPPRTCRRGHALLQQTALLPSPLERRVFRYTHTHTPILTHKQTHTPRTNELSPRTFRTKCSLVPPSQVSLRWPLPPRCRPRPCPPRLGPLLSSPSLATPASRTARCPPPSARSAWPGSGRRALSTPPSSPPATRHPWDRGASGPSWWAAPLVSQRARRDSRRAWERPRGPLVGQFY